MNNDAGVIKHISEILSRPHVTGCSFAADHFKKDLVAVGTVRVKEDIEPVFRGAAAKEMVAVAVLPNVECERELREFVSTLDENWRIVWDNQRLSLDRRRKVVELYGARTDASASTHAKNSVLRFGTLARCTKQKH